MFFLTKLHDDIATIISVKILCYGSK